MRLLDRNSCQAFSVRMVTCFTFVLISCRRIHICVWLRAYFSVTMCVQAICIWLSFHQFRMIGLHPFFHLLMCVVIWSSFLYRHTRYLCFNNLGTTLDVLFAFGKQLSTPSWRLMVMIWLPDALLALILVISVPFSRC